MPGMHAFRCWFVDITRPHAAVAVARAAVLQGFDYPAMGFWFWLELFINLIFAADIVVNFMTAYEASTHARSTALVDSHEKHRLLLKYQLTK